MAKKIRCHVISHTHWDREWYQPMSRYRKRLVEMIDNLIDIFEKDPSFKYFTFDGQTVVLEDYLEVKPENADVIKRYVEEGRLVIGPWYLLPDEFLIGSEAHIRNGLLGDKLARRFGKKMTEGYLPDSFGHISQMPQILRGFGMDTAILWRGVSHEVKKSEFTWKAPDGTDVLAAHLPFGYFTGAGLPPDPEESFKRIDGVWQGLDSLTDSSTILFMNGFDHLEAQPELPEILEYWNSQIPEVEFVHSTIPQYLSELRSQLSGSLQVYNGEMRSGDRATLLGSTSTRMYLKQLYNQIDTMMQYEVEPSAAFAAVAGMAYPKALIWHAWKHLLKNTPHDSICGCSVDSVHDEMMIRFDRCTQLGNDLTSDALSYLVDKLDTSSLGETNLVAFNTLNQDRTEVIDAIVDFDEEIALKVDLEAGCIRECADTTPSFPSKVRIFDETGREFPAVLSKTEKAIRQNVYRFAFPDQSRVNRCHISFLASEVPAMGWKTFRAVPEYDKPGLPRPASICEERVMENRFYLVQIHNNGTLTVRDKTTGLVLDGCHTFEDGADVGDEYTFCPAKFDEILTTRSSRAEITWEEKNDLKQVMRIDIPFELPVAIEEGRSHRTDEKVICNISTRVTLPAYSRRIDFCTTVDNKAKDHRLRVLVPSPLNVDKSSAEGCFDVVDRPVETPVPEKWSEKAANVHPQKTFVSISDGEFGVTLINKGLPEYQIIDTRDGSAIALTLLRCVEWLSRGDLSMRDGHGGWPHYTPGAQCQGSHTFEYSIVTHEGNWEKAESFLAAHAFNIEPLLVQTGKHGGELPATTSLVELDSEKFVVSSFKGAEDDDGCILRFFNMGATGLEGSVKFNFAHKSVERCRIDETVLETLNPEDGKYKLSTRPKEIITLRIK